MGMLQKPTLRGNFPRMNNSEGLAILNLRLASVPKRGDPFQAVVNYLEAFFQPSLEECGLVALDLAFSINPDKIKDLEEHQAIVGQFVMRLCR